MPICTAVVEEYRDSCLHVGYAPGLRVVHSQGAMIEELRGNLLEAIRMLLEDGDRLQESELVGTQQPAIYR